MSKTLIIIAGPTAIGKTSLAISLAKHFKTEIISADSRQFYREMNIGTAKPSEVELKEVKHHLINSHSILDQFNAGDFEKESIELINKLFLDHDQVIMAGGSGLFINAVSHGFDQLPIASEEIRNYFNTILEEKGIKFLQDRLKKIDPVYYNEVDIFNPQRVIRALEVFECSGKTFSSLRTNIKKQRPFNIVKIGLNTDRHILYERINRRVDQMIKEGLIEEVDGLKSYRHLNPLNTVGYSEILNYLDGKSNREEAIEKIKQNTRRFAKRQITWFKKSEDIKWYKPDELEPIIQYLNSILY
ncbi:tRNA (adenosine(37)-N6)-dimethylallyltransferase MiaA [Daejeonella sp.]|uniref:tRNA (adenosine(37)-N6)-dimethylallyltransferase MiaA n=1 Tax=Daejeonella sp. TaxID=2805397 RepID=UPI0027BA7657|nr:tRNA (adenosine(37)-N6)-dimethylallyltransferase MiaA [Daejeonella sp.]